MFAGTQFCPRCGARAARERVDQPTSLACPGCTAEMHAVRVGATPLHECPECASTWLDGEAFTALCSSREERGVVASSVGSALPQPPRSPQSPVRYVPCPVCKKLMNRSNFGNRSGVVIDTCGAHGVWLEHDELRRVLTFIDTGGLVRARAMDRHKADAERDLARLVREGAPRAASGGMGALHLTRDEDDGSLLREVLRGLFS